MVNVTYNNTEDLQTPSLIEHEELETHSNCIYRNFKSVKNEA